MSSHLANVGIRLAALTVFAFMSVVPITGTASADELCPDGGTPSADGACDRSGPDPFAGMESVGGASGNPSLAGNPAVADACRSAGVGDYFIDENLPSGPLEGCPGGPPVIPETPDAA